MPVSQQFLPVVCKYAVLLADRAVGVKDGLRQPLRLDRAQLPFQESKPQDKVGNRDGARVEVEAEELTGADRFPLE